MIGEDLIAAGYKTINHLIRTHGLIGAKGQLRKRPKSNTRQPLGFSTRTFKFSLKNQRKRRPSQWNIVARLRFASAIAAFVSFGFLPMIATGQMPSPPLNRPLLRT